MIDDGGEFIGSITIKYGPEWVIVLFDPPKACRMAPIEVARICAGLVRNTARLNEFIICATEALMDNIEEVTGVRFPQVARPFPAPKGSA